METVVAMKAKEKKAKEIAARKKQKGGRQKLAGTVAAAGENKSNFIFLNFLFEFYLIMKKLSDVYGKGN